MQRTILFFPFIMFATSLLHFGCNDKIVGPPTRNPRELSWSIDTLAYPGYNQTSMSDIWGSSATNVYVVGHNSCGGGKMYHFDGKRWTDVKLSATQGGNVVGAFDLAAIYGFGPDDIWAVGEYLDINPDPLPNFLTESLAIHFDGSQWWEFPVPQEKALMSIWGSSPSDIWMGGLDGTLLHFDGTSVKKDSVPVSIPEDVYRDYFLSNLTGLSSNEVYMLLTAWGSTSTPRQYLFGRQADSWVVLDSTFFPEAGILWMNPSGTLYAAGYDRVYQRQGTSWINIADEILKNALG